jgi:alpha-beta hydrolase superfamily lysophospholipase
VFQTLLLQLPQNELGNSPPVRLPCVIAYLPSQSHPERPAILYLHGWNGYPYNSRSRDLGPALADCGFTVLSLGLRRRGVEGQMRSLPTDDLDDIALIVAYLSELGWADFLLLGEGIGALSAARYPVERSDARIRGIVLLHPFPDLAPWLEQTIGRDRYEAISRQTGSDVVTGADGEVWIDLTVEDSTGEPLSIYQRHSCWQAWWGRTADTRISNWLERLSIPCLQVGDTTDGYLAQGSSVQSERGKWIGEGEDVVRTMVDWVRGLSLSTANRFDLPQSDVTAPLEIATVQTADGSDLVGLLWETRLNSARETAVLHVWGKTGTPITEPLFATMAERYNSAGLGAMVIELRRSGYGGSLRSPAEWDVEDIDAHVETLLARGYRHIVLSGISLGSNSIMRYQAQRCRPEVIALVHMAPTQDCAVWLQQHIGKEAYDDLVTQAETAFNAGRGESGLIGQPPYQWMLSPLRPRAWLSWNGPAADTANLKTIVEIDIPILLMCGSNDFFNDRERLDRLKNAAIKSPVTDIIWYEDCGHNFAGFQRRAADDVVHWLRHTTSVLT